MNFHLKKGQSLVEVIFAVSIAALILIGIVTVVASGVRNTSFSRNKALATRYVQEASEYLREQRDSDWDTFIPYASPSATYCLSSLSSGLTAGECSSGDEVSDTPFSREVVLSASSSAVVHVVISVEWSDAQGLHEVRSVARYTDWR